MLRLAVLRTLDHPQRSHAYACGDFGICDVARRDTSEFAAGNNFRIALTLEIIFALFVI